MMQTKFPRLYFILNFACLAQLVEQLPCKHQVGNSSFSAGTILAEEVGHGFILSVNLLIETPKAGFSNKEYIY